MADIEFKINRRRAGGSITVSEILAIHPEANEVTRDVDRVVMVYDMRGPTNAIVGTTSEFIILMNDTEETVHIRIITDPGGHVVHNGAVLVDGLLDIDPNELIRIDKAANGVNPIFATTLTGSGSGEALVPGRSSSQSIYKSSGRTGNGVGTHPRTAYRMIYTRIVPLDSADEWVNHTMFYPSLPDYEPVKANVAYIYLTKGIFQAIADEVGGDLSKIDIDVTSCHAYADWFGEEFTPMVSFTTPIKTGLTPYMYVYTRLLFNPKTPTSQPVFGKEIRIVIDLSISYRVPDGEFTGLPGADLPRDFPEGEQ